MDIKLHNEGDMTVTKTVEASEIGLSVGEWPDEIEYNGARYRRHTTERDRENEVISVSYLPITLAITLLRVYND